MGTIVKNGVNYSGSGGQGTNDYDDLINKPSIENVTLNGNKTASDLGLAKTIQYSVLPEPTSERVGQIYQYTGATTALFTHGYWYECQSTGTGYTWVETSGGGTDYTAGDGIDITNDTISVDPMPAEDMGDVIDELPTGGNIAVTGYVPLGTLIPYYGETAPDFFLACDGATYNKSDYPELAKHLLSLTNHSQYVVDGDNTKFKVPDLRGEFIRGTGSNSHTGNGNGASVGTHQNATTLPLAYSTSSGNICGVANGSVENADTNINALARDYVKKTSSDTYGQSFSTRPTNTSVLFCIAYKDIYSNPMNDYSTDEKVVGTWIDGKTLYQKTFVTEAPTVTTQGTEVHKYIDIGSAVDYAEVVNCNQGSGVSFTNSPTRYWLRTTETPNYARPVFYVIPFINAYEDVSYKNKLRLTCSDTGLNGHTFYITLRYTKA